MSTVKVRALWWFAVLAALLAAEAVFLRGYLAASTQPEEEIAWLTLPVGTVLVCLAGGLFKTRNSTLQVVVLLALLGAAGCFVLSYILLVRW